MACTSQEVPGTDQPEVKEKAIKTMTYNIYGARSGGIKNLDEIAEVIKKADPDLVALQEVDRFTERNGKDVDIAKELAEMCGMEYFFARAIDIGGGQYGDAVLSKFPIVTSTAYTMSVDPSVGGEQRSVALITVDIDDNTLNFVSTHFDHLGDETNRLRQARELNDILGKIEGPLIVGGDFNALPDSETISILRQELVLGCRNNHCDQKTFPTSNPNRTIDYLFYKGINKLSVLNYSVYDWANRESDHFPVIATFNLKLQ